jgi:hypothetical protein
MGDLWTAVRGWWAAAAGSQRLAYLAGAGLILVGVALGRTSSGLGPFALLDASTLLYLLAAGAAADGRRLRRQGRAAPGRGGGVGQGALKVGLQRHRRGVDDSRGDLINLHQD